MNPTWHAVQLGLQRGGMELRQSFTNGQDLFGQLFWVVVMLVSLYFMRDNTLQGTTLSAAAFTLPSMVGLAVGFNGLITLSQQLTVEREDGTLLRAKAVPHGMLGYLVGKIFAVSGSVVAGMVLLLVPGALLLDGLALDEVGGWLTLAWVVVLGLVASLPIGAIIGSVVDSPRSIGLIMLPMIGLIGISGIFYPLSLMPPWLQAAGQLFPLYWLGLGVRSALLPDTALAVEIGNSWRVLETVGVLGAWAVIGLVVAPIVLRRMARRESGSSVAVRREKAMQRVG